MCKIAGKMVNIFNNSDKKAELTSYVGGHSRKSFLLSAEMRAKSYKPVNKNH